MISGAVNAYREAVVELTLHGPGRTERRLHAVVDTGFDGMLTLPAALTTSLDLRWRSRGRALLADGSESVFDIHEATVTWMGVSRRILIDVVETTPLIGMSLLEGHKLTIDAIEGGAVRIDPLSG